MIKVEDGNISLQGSDEELEDEITHLLVACAGNKGLIKIMNHALKHANMLLTGGNTNECKDS